MVLKTLVAASVMALAGVAQAGSLQQSGWTAQRYLVGQTSTGTVASGGNPLYLAPAAQYSGVATIITTYSNGDAFICAGTLLNDRRSVLTAGHCVSGGPNSEKPAMVEVYFNDSADRDTVAYANPASTRYEATAFVAHQNYTGEVIDQHDIAVVTLGQAVDARYKSYGLFGSADLTGQDFNVAGYGGRSSGGGNVGADLGTGRLRQGDNRFDFSFGDADFAGFWTDRDANGENFFGFAEIDNVWLSDFDNGLAVNDLSCRIGAALGVSGAKYCNTGRGATEVGVAGGDSGGPEFINGAIAAVTSFGLSFGTGFGDVGGGLNSSFGEFSGYASVAYNYDFIMSRYIPEPSSLALVAFAGVALVLRRRKAAAQA